MKRKNVFITVVLFWSVAFSACSRREVSGEPKTLQDLNNRVIGLLVSPILVGPNQIKESLGFLPSEVRAFSTSNDLVSALKTKRVDAMLTTEETSKFLISADERLAIIPSNLPSNGLRMILRDTDAALLAELNAGIAELRAKSILDTLYEQYIANVTVDNLAEAPAQVPLIEGAETILAGINGDLPPYDYISADGKPSGYNAALMTELSRVLGKNVQFVTIPSEARFSALLSKNSRRMDLFFWFYGNLTMDSLVLTDAYTQVDECILVRK
ncbi:MAG: transporter substrate-binding domain-containing protein [Treponema sp.]|jgi:ABC-type amino acid transport substrate-binding protein|nr:transporter substrate-binding domain-containing protein [Treponema sp.]